MRSHSARQRFNDYAKRDTEAHSGRRPRPPFIPGSSIEEPKSPLRNVLEETRCYASSRLSPLLRLRPRSRPRQRSPGRAWALTGMSATNGAKTAVMNAASIVAKSVASDTGTMVAGGIMARAHAGDGWDPCGFGSAASETAGE